MKKPSKPSEPKKPNEPKEYLDPKNTLLEQLKWESQIRLSTFKALAEKYNINPEDIWIDVEYDRGYYDSISIEFYAHANVNRLNPYFEKEMKQYEKKLNQYKEKYKKYKKQLEIYNEEMEKWRKFDEQKRYEEAKKIVDKLGKKFEKDN